MSQSTQEQPKEASDYTHEGGNVNYRSYKTVKKLFTQQSHIIESTQMLGGRSFATCRRRQVGINNKQRCVKGSPSGER